MDTGLLATVIGGGLALAIVGIYLLRNSPQWKRKGYEARLKKEQKTLDDLEGLKDKMKPQMVPDIPDSDVGGINAGFGSLEEIPMGTKVGIELTKIRNMKRVVVLRGQVAIKPDRFGRMPTLFIFSWKNQSYYIKPNKIIEVTVRGGIVRKNDTMMLKLVYDIAYSEPLNQDGSIDWDQELEDKMMDSGMDQYVAAATLETGFRLTRQLVTILVIVGLLAGFMGLAINGVTHLVPTTIIHWVR